MDSGKETSSHEKLIDDYLFSGYKPDTYESTFDSDQQFAKPIEDEDMFASVECDKACEPEQPRRLKEKYKELAKGIVPRRFAADRDDDDMIEIEITNTQPERNSNATAIFDKAVLKRVKDRYGLYKGQKLFWDKYNDFLHKKISADKRTQWDSLQLNLDRYDDEEELMVDKENDDNNSGAEEELHADEDEYKEAIEDEANVSPDSNVKKMAVGRSKLIEDDDDDDEEDEGDEDEEDEDEDVGLDEDDGDVDEEFDEVANEESDNNDSDDADGRNSESIHDEDEDVDYVKRDYLDDDEDGVCGHSDANMDGEEQAEKANSESGCIKLSMTRSKWIDDDDDDDD